MERTPKLSAANGVTLILLNGLFAFPFSMLAVTHRNLAKKLTLWEVKWIPLF
jgi:hypothetical protein